MHDITRYSCRRLVVALAAALMLTGCAQTFEDDLLDPGPEFSAFAANQNTVRARAKAYFRAANYSLAERTYRSAIARNGRDSEAWLGLAAACDRLGRYADADRAYAEATALSGRRPEILNNMAFSRLARGDRAGAAALFAEAVKLAPENPVIAANAASLAKTPTAKS